MRYKRFELRRKTVVFASCLALCSIQQGCGTDIHWHSDDNQTLITGADSAMKTFTGSDKGITPTAETDINALMTLQETVDNRQLDLGQSFSSYDSVNQTWNGLRADFLKQVGLLIDDEIPKTDSKAVSDLIKQRSDLLENRIALRLVEVNSITTLLDKLVSTENKLADDAQKNLQTAIGTVNATQPSEVTTATAPAAGDTPPMSASEVQEFVQFEKLVLGVVKNAAEAQLGQADIATKQQTANQLEQQLLKQIGACRDSDAVAALAPLIGTGLDDQSMIQLEKLIADLNTEINKPSAPQAAVAPPVPALALAAMDVKVRTDADSIDKLDPQLESDAESIVVGGEPPKYFTHAAWVRRDKEAPKPAWAGDFQEIRRKVALANAVVGIAPASNQDFSTIPRKVNRALRLAYFSNGLGHQESDPQAMMQQMEHKGALLRTNPKLYAQAVVIDAAVQISQSSKHVSAQTSHALLRKKKLSDLKADLDNFQAKIRRSRRYSQLQANSTNPFYQSLSNPDELRKATSLTPPTPPQGNAHSLYNGAQYSVLLAAAQAYADTFDNGKTVLGSAANRLDAVKTSLSKPAVPAAAVLEAAEASAPALAPASAPATVDKTYTDEINSIVPSLNSLLQRINGLGNKDAGAAKLSKSLSSLIAKLQSATRPGTPIANFLAVIGGSSAESKTLLGDLTSFFSTHDFSFTGILTNPQLADVMDKTILSTTWLTSFVAGIDPKAAAQISANSPGGTLLNSELSGPLGDLGTKLSGLLQGETQDRLDLIQEYLNQLYQFEVSMHQEQSRHFKALQEVSQLEIRRWTILQEINQNVSVTFDSLGVGGANYFPFEALQEVDYTTAQGKLNNAPPSEGTAPQPAPTTAPSSVPSTQPSPAGAAATEPSPSAAALRAAQEQRLKDAMARGLAQFPPVDDRNLIRPESEIFASLRAMTILARQHFMVADDKGGTDEPAIALAANQRLKDLIKLLNSSLLMESENLRFSLSDARQLNRELMWHELQLDQLQSAVEEANIQYYLDDLKIYHSGGITKEDVEAITHDVAEAVELGIIAGKVK